MSNVVQFRPPERQRDAHPAFRITGETTRMVLEDPGHPWHPEDLKQIALDLINFGLHLHSRSREATGSGPDDALVWIALWRSGHVSTFSSSDIETDEQVEWAKRQLGLVHICTGDNCRDCSPA